MLLPCCYLSCLGLLRPSSSVQLPASHPLCLERRPPYSPSLPGLPSLPDCTLIKMWTDAMCKDCPTPPDQVSSQTPCSGLPCVSTSLPHSLLLHFIPVLPPRERIESPFSVLPFPPPQNGQGSGNRSAKPTCRVQVPPLSLHPIAGFQLKRLALVSQRGHIPPTSTAHLG